MSENTTVIGDSGNYCSTNQSSSPSLIDKQRQTIITHNEEIIFSIHDPVYGYFEFTHDKEFSRLLHSLLFKCSAVRRLDKIHQAGAFFLWNTQKYNVTRLEHSIGVMLLIRKLSPTNHKQQIAALLHDISHTAFSHLVDIILENRKDDFHETILDSIIQAPNDKFINCVNNSLSLMDILTEFGMQDVVENLKLDKYTLLEKDFPMLCADRIDYTLRDVYCYKLLNFNQEEFSKMVSCLERIEFEEKEIISFSIENIISAELFMKFYKVLVVDFFLGLPNLFFNDLLGDLLRECIKIDIITIEDMIWGDDLYCLSKILTYNKTFMNQKIIEMLNIVKFRDNIVSTQNKSLIEQDVIENYVEIVTDPAESDYLPKRKKRVIDFKIQQSNGRFEFISECSDFAKIMFAEMNNQEQTLLPMKRKINNKLD